MAHEGKQNQEEGNKVLYSRYPTEVLESSRALEVLLNEPSSAARYDVTGGHLTQMMNWAQIFLFWNKISAAWTEEAALTAKAHKQLLLL